VMYAHLLRRGIAVSRTAAQRLRASLRTVTKPDTGNLCTGTWPTLSAASLQTLETIQAPRSVMHKPLLGLVWRYARRPLGNTYSALLRSTSSPTRIATM
jgi:hypothetical protein